MTASNFKRESKSQKRAIDSNGDEVWFSVAGGVMTPEYLAKVKALHEAQISRTQTEEPPTPRGFEAPPCSACRALAKGKNYARVYATKREEGTIVRYCRCDFCGNTFKVTGE